MVTKVSNYQGNLALSKNFEPTSISELTISHSGGAVVGDGAIVETVAGSIVVPANTVWSVYASLATGLLVASATSAVPSTNALILWQGISGGNTTTFIDKRSWASTAKFVTSGVGFNEFLTTNFNLNHDWRMEETSGTAIDSGTASTTHDLSTTGSGLTYDQTGDVSYETDQAIDWDGTTNARLSKQVSANLNTINSGSFGIVFKTPTDQNGNMLFGYGGAFTSDFTFLIVFGINSLKFAMRDSNSDDVLIQSNVTPKLDDGNYHMVNLVQPGNSTGIKMYVDGILQTLIVETYQGIFDNNAWWPESTGAGRIAIGSAPVLGNNHIDGTISRCWITDDEMSAADITALQGARTTAIPT